MLDAFSSDAVPVHLLSREAIALYRRKLGPGGVLAFNLSNRYLDLDPLMDRQARDAGLVCRIRYDLDVSLGGEVRTASSRRSGPSWPRAKPTFPASPPTRGGERPRRRPGSIAWTDDYSDLASYLVFRPRWTGGRSR